MSDTSSKETEPVPASRPQKIPVGWETRRLSELATNHDSKRVPLKQTDRDRRRGDYPYYGASGIIDSIDGFLFDGDFVLLGEDGENVVSRHLPLAFRVTGQFWVNNHAHVYEPCHEVDIRFLVGLLDATDFSGLVSGSAQPKLTQEALQRLRFIVPPYGEQRAITAVLDTIDDAIQKTEQIIAKLQQLKQGLLHDLLTRGIDDNGELRDPERHPEQFQDSPLGRIPKRWRVGGLQEVGATDRQPILTGPFGSHLCAADFVDSGVPLLRIGNVQWGRMDLDDLLYIRPSKALELERYRVAIGDLLFARQGATTGRNALVDDRAEAAVINYHIIRVAVDRSKCNPTYLYFVFNSPVVQGQVNREKGRSTREGVNTATLTGFLMPLPGMAEQDAMSELIEEYDARLRREHATLSKLRITKIGLSDDLLTGRVRTTSLPEFSA